MTATTSWIATSLAPSRQPVRIGITGLARSGKTVLLTSLAANLLAAGAGYETLPALQARLGRRSFRVTLSPSEAGDLPRFDHPAHLAALIVDPPAWPARTDAVSVLALDVDIGRGGVRSLLPPRRFRLELVDYPGEWLLDLPMLTEDFRTWSQATLYRLGGHDQTVAFRNFLASLPAAAPADDALARDGQRLFAAGLRALRDEVSLSMLQPGRFLMPPPGARPPWLNFFPLPGRSPLAGLLAKRYDAYRDAVRRDLLSPGFGRLDRLVVVADVLSALHAGETAFADARAALASVARGLRWRPRVPLLGEWFGRLLGGIHRVAFVATKADQVAERQRGNLAALVRSMAELGGSPAKAEAFAIASMRCTEDIVWTLDGRPVSAVRGRVAGEGRAGRSFPGEVPDRVPTGEFWRHPFLSLPDFEPLRVPLNGRAGMPHVDLDRLLVFLLEDLL